MGNGNTRTTIGLTLFFQFEADGQLISYLEQQLAAKIQTSWQTESRRNCCSISFWWNDAFFSNCRSINGMHNRFLRPLKVSWCEFARQEVCSDKTYSSDGELQFSDSMVGQNSDRYLQALGRWVSPLGVVVIHRTLAGITNELKWVSLISIYTMIMPNWQPWQKATTHAE